MGEYPKDSMHILFIIPSITNYHTFLKELINSLVERGYKVSLLAGEKAIVEGNNPYGEPIGCTWIKVNFPRSFQPQKHLKTSLVLDRYIKEIKPDIVHIHFSAAMFTAGLAYKKNWPFTLATIHGLAWPARKGSTRTLLKNAEFSSAKKMDEVFVLNREDKQALIENGVKHCKVLPGNGLGCLIDDFDPHIFSKEDNDQLRQELGISESDKVFIFIGRQTHFKGFHLVIRAFMQLYHSLSRYKLIIIGGKDLIHPTGLSKTEEDLLNLIPSIIQIEWKTNVAKYLSIAHVNVFPSSREGWPVNLMESLSMGVPVITNNSRGCRDVVEHEKNGIILQDNSVEAIADTMKLLATNDALREKYRNYALKNRTKFDRKLFIDYQEEYYKSIHEITA